jgi:hypothetical protein
VSIRSDPPFFTTPAYGRPKGTTREHPSVQPEPQATADCHQLVLTPGRRLRTRAAGVFLFLPLLAQLRFDDLVTRAGYPGSGMIPPPAALLSLLTLKLLDKERRSHITDFDFDEAMGLFAGLNVLPKKSYATDYSYRTLRTHQQALLSRWVAALAPVLFPEAQEFCLDFHAIPFRGEPEAAENHYLPMRGKAAPSILSFVAYEPQSRVLCYSNADLTRADQAAELMRFVDFWHDLIDQDPQWLYFDSKVVPYSELAKVAQRRIWFVTIRRRGAAIVRRLNAVPARAWRRAVIDIPKRCHKNIRYLDETVKLRDYPEKLRQVAVAGLGRDEPTLCLSNNFQVSARELITRYVKRNGVEDALGISVNFFHVDCLTSEVRLNVDLDLALTVIAHGCYRWLTTRLPGYDKSKPKQAYQRFVATGGVVETQTDRIVVRFDKRAHNPILRAAALDQDCPPIPWLGGLRIVFVHP